MILKLFSSLNDSMVLWNIGGGDPDTANVQLHMLGNIQQSDRSDSAQRSADYHKSRLL